MFDLSNSFYTTLSKDLPRPKNFNILHTYLIRKE